eukprot:6492734-Amphidinium_carterae.4
MEGDSDDALFAQWQSNAEDDGGFWDVAAVECLFEDASLVQGPVQQKLRNTPKAEASVERLNLPPLLPPPLPDAPDAANAIAGLADNAGQAAGSLMPTADFMVKRLAQHADLNMEASANDLGVDRKTLRQRLQALAESAVHCQTALVNRVLKYSADLDGRTLKPLCFMQSQAYDETPMKIRIAKSDKVGERRKVFVVEQKWGALLQVTDAGGKEGFLFLKGSWSPMVRAADSGVGEAIRNVLLSCLPQYEQSLRLCSWQHVWRLVETDNLGANHRAERLYRATQAEQLKHLHAICVAHQVHSSATRTFNLEAGLISDIISCCKVLGENGLRSQFRECVRQSLPQWLHRVETQMSALPEGAKAFREEVLAYVLPSRTDRPRLRALILLMADLLNGDWREQGRLTHWCKKGCCRSQQHTLNKMMVVLPKAFTVLCKGMFSRGNWSSWPQQLQFFILGAIHGFLGHTLAKIFSGAQHHDGGNDGRDADQRVALAVAVTPACDDAGVAENPLEPWEAERESQARCRQQAVAFLAKTDWPSRLLLLRGALAPETMFMQKLLRSTSLEAKLRRIRDTSPQNLPVLQVVNQQWADEMFYGCKQQLMSIGMDLPETETLRSDILRLCFKSAGVVWLLVAEKYNPSAMPWRLFTLLSDASQSKCEEMLAMRPCCLEDFSRDFLTKHNSTEALLSPEVQAMLHCLASMLDMTTFSTERLHSRNIRRQRKRQQLTYDIDLTSLALHHMALSGENVALAASMEDSAQERKKRGRPLKEKTKARKSEPPQLQGDEELAVAHRKRRKLKAVNPTQVAARGGGGGAWRAFIADYHKGEKMTKASLLAAGVAYHALDVEAKQHFIEVGCRGPRGCRN